MTVNKERYSDNSLDWAFSESRQLYIQQAEAPSVGPSGPLSSSHQRPQFLHHATESIRPPCSNIASMLAGSNLHVC